MEITFENKFVFLLSFVSVRDTLYIRVEIDLEKCIIEGESEKIELCYVVGSFTAIVGGICPYCRSFHLFNISALDLCDFFGRRGD